MEPVHLASVVINISNKQTSCEFMNMEFYDYFTDLLNFKI